MPPLKPETHSGVTVGGPKRQTSDLTRARLRAAHAKRIKLAPPTFEQAKLLAAVKAYPSLLKRDYATLLFRLNTDYARRKIDAALKGLLARGLVRLYSACHCGFPLVRHGKNAHKCNACGSVCANVYVKEERICVSAPA